MVRAELLLVSRERAAAERLGLGQLALRPEQMRQVVHGGERVQVVRAELLLVALERAAEERLGLGQLAPLPEQPCQVVHGAERAQVLHAELLLQAFERAAELVDGPRHQLLRAERDYPGGCGTAADGVRGPIR